MTGKAEALSRWERFGRRGLGRTPVRYLFGLAMTAAAYGLRVLFAQWTGKGAPFVLFFGAVLATSLLAGFGPGLLVLVVSLPLAAVTFSIPGGATASEAAFQALLYAIDGLIILELARLTRQARRRAQQIITLAPDAYFQANLAGRFVDVNQAACKLLGYARDELVGKSILDIIPPEDAPRLASVRRALLEPGAVELGEWTLLRKDRTPVAVEIGANILPDGRWQAFVRDIGERKRAEDERLRAAEQRHRTEEQFRLLFEEAPNGVALVALDGRFVRVNKALCDILGYTSDELERRTYQEITPPEDLEAGRRLGERVHRGEAAKYQLEKRYIRKDGSTVMISVSGSIVRDAEGRPLHYIAQIEDITERKRAEEALRASEAKFRQLVEGMPDGVFIFQGGRVGYANLSFGALLGYDDVRAVLGRSIEQFVAPESVDVVRARVRRVQETGGRAPPQELTMMRRDGSRIVVETVGIATEFEGASAIVVVVRDLADRLRSEREQRLLAEVGVALAATLDYEQTLASVARLAVRDFADWCMVEVMEPYEGLKRLKVECADPTKTALAAELERIPLDRERPYIMKPVVESHEMLLVHRVTPARVEAAAQGPDHLRMLRALEPTSVLSVPLKLRDELLGTLTFVSSRASRLFGTADARLAAAIAERATLAIENARLYRAALHATGLRDQVLSVVAHDLRNPLSTISLHASALQRPHPEPERRTQRHREAIERAARRMSRLIQDLLDVAVLEGSGRINVEPVPLSAGDLVGEAVDMQRALAGSSAIELRLQIAAGVPEILGDRDRLLQVFENLIGNALKFTDAGGQVTVGVAPGDSGALFWVADTGRGMTHADLARVFDRFWQASARSGRLGAGLGLPITKGIVEAHGGRIWVESEPGRGSAFFFSVPSAPLDARDADLLH
jgi:PAS domain S-box-containing protein